MNISYMNMLEKFGGCTDGYDNDYCFLLVGLESLNILFTRWSNEPWARPALGDAFYLFGLSRLPRLNHFKCHEVSNLYCHSSTAVIIKQHRCTVWWYCKMFQHRFRRACMMRSGVVTETMDLFGWRWLYQRTTADNVEESEKCGENLLEQ